MTDTAPHADQQLADIREEMAEARVSLMMFRSALGSTMGQISDTISQIGRGTAPLEQAQREADMYRARWESTVVEAKRQHAEAARLRQHVEELQEKVLSFDDNGKCCCSFEGPGDVCLVHSPTVDRLRAELAAARAVLDGDDLPLLCPDCLCADCGGTLGQHTPAGVCSCGCDPACDRFCDDSKLTRIADAVEPLTGSPLSEAIAHTVWHALNDTPSV